MRYALALSAVQFLLAAALAATLAIAPARAQLVPANGGFQSAAPAASAAATPAQEKIGPFLRGMVSDLAARGVTRSNALSQGVANLSNPFVKVDQRGRVQVYLHLSDTDAARLAELRRLEVEVEIVNDDLAMVQGWVPYDRVEAVAGLGFVERVVKPTYARARTGSVNTQGDAIHLADQLRALGVDGSGVRVGVISTGTFGLATAQASGDVPAGITEFGTCNVGVFGVIGCAEGTAMLEIVHDLAPGATLGFGTAGSSMEFIQHVDALADTFGADIIVDDIGFFGEPFFEDGPVAQKVASRTNDLVYASSAGNSADGHYESDFSPRNVTIAGQAMVAHSFSGSDVGLDFTVQGGGSITIFMQWTDPFGGSGNNYDLLAFNTALTAPLCPTCNSTFVQNGNDDPFEALALTNGGATPASGTLVIRRTSGVNRRIELFVLGSGISFQQYNIPAGSIFGHPAAPGALGTAAISASDPGNDTIEFFSSRGPSFIAFPSPENRQTPAISGIDGVSVTGAGGFPNPFFGTSAAAPHIAGLAALLIEIAPNATPQEIVTALQSSAVDLGPAGFDTTFGAGRADVLAAASSLGFPFFRNDVLASFAPGQRFWARLNNSTWKVLNGASPLRVVTGRMDNNQLDEVIADFGPPLGLWVYRNNSNWQKLHGSATQALATGHLDAGTQADVVASFGPPLGVWARMNDSSWVKLNGNSAELLATADLDNNGQDEIIADFGPVLGLWVYRNNTSWQKLHGSSPVSMAGADLDNDGRDELVVNFGAPLGVWARFNDSSWVKLNGLAGQGLTVADMDGNGIDEVAVDFGALGLWVLRNNSSWQKIHGTSPQELATADIDSSGAEEIIVDFGAPLGLWARVNNATWQKLNGLSPQAIEGGNIDGQ